MERYAYQPVKARYILIKKITATILVGRGFKADFHSNPRVIKIKPVFTFYRMQ